LRTCLTTIAKLGWGAYLLLTSVYCLLAFLPYTYVAVIKEPPYEWIPWFANHQAFLYFTALAGVAAVTWRRSSLFWILPGVYLAVRPFLPTVQDNWAAYVWSLTALVPIVVIAAIELRRDWPKPESGGTQNEQLPYSVALIIAAVVSVIYTLGVAVRAYVENRSWHFGAASGEVAAWSLISHMLLAIIIVSILNLSRVAASRSRNPKALNFALTACLTFFFLWIASYRFLNSALSFGGRAAQLYAAFLAAALTLWGAWLVRPLSRMWDVTAKWKFPAAIVLAGICVFAVLLPTIIAGSDWDGVLQGTFTLTFWVVVGLCIFRLWPQRTSYSLTVTLAVVLLAGFSYKALKATEIFWGKPLGATDDDLARAMANYAEQDASFQLVHHFLGNGRSEACDDLCRILRENTNVRDAEVKDDLQLVGKLTPSNVPHPNIFFFVIDSLRADYVGAYNPKVDFTPNLNAFARDSVVVHNAYTQYAGTSLSEPVIWAGAMLLHAHYPQPFSKVNSLEKLAHADGYHMIVSYDEILRQLLSPSDDLVKLDTDKKTWNQLEVCSTIRQLEPLLANGSEHTQPILFYAQPKNVHQFARNDLPMIRDDHWQTRKGFDNRIAHEVWQVDTCLGDFFSFLKTRGMYENSIIIVTSDHGDATGEFGRYSHSLSIYPEVMRVPLIVHLPAEMRQKMVYDDTHISALTDLTPSLYYLLGHRPIRSNPLFGHPLFVESEKELTERDALFLASDERAVYGLLTENGRFLYATYDSPEQSFLFDLSRDPNAEHNVLTASGKKMYDEEIIRELQTVAEFYGYKPGLGSLLAARK
jgi:sulfatase-like protein